MKRQNTVQSKLYCSVCHKEGIPIWRKKNKLKEKGHMKKMYCIHCQKETNHAEQRHADKLAPKL